jgi:hypothetical protein
VPLAQAALRGALAQVLMVAAQTQQPRHLAVRETTALAVPGVDRTQTAQMVLSMVADTALAVVAAAALT